MINTIILEGRLTKDIELKTFNDTKVINNTIAVYGGKRNEEDITYFFDFKAFNYQAEQLSKNATKGSKIVIEGALTQDKWEKDGQQMSKVVIIVESIGVLAKQESTKEQIKDLADSMKMGNDNLPF